MVLWYLRWVRFSVRQSFAHTQVDTIGVFVQYFEMGHQD